MQISYVTTYDASNIRNWSGTGFHIAKAIEDQGVVVDYIGNLHYPFEQAFKAKTLWYRWLGKRYLRDRSPFAAKSFAAQVQQRISADTDIIFSPGTIPVAYLKTDKPKVIYTDATFGGMIGYYENFSNLCAETIRDGHAIEQAALDSCRLALFSSDWAAQTAIQYYGTPAGKVKVVPFGANIECNRTLSDITELVNSRPDDTCSLLFLAVEWERKGGDTVLQTAKLLNEMGLKTELHIVGIPALPVTSVPDFVKLHGFINKSQPDGQAKLTQIIQSSHFLFLPSKADCTPIVFSEANSFGLPVISTRTGGIPTIVRDHVNGMTFDLQATPHQYAQWIYDIFTRQTEYYNLALSSFNDYETRLNWQVTGKTIVQLLKDL